MEAIIIPVETFDQLIEARSRALSSARGSLRAKGLSAPSEAEEIMARLATGEISTTQMRRLVRRLAGAE